MESITETLEIWKDCKGYEGLYQVSNLGRVKSLPRVRRNHIGGVWIQEGKIKKGTVNYQGYVHVRLTGKSGKAKTEKVHRLVALVFCDKPEGATEVDHIDGNRKNNRADNLQWVSHKENINKRFEDGTAYPYVIRCRETGEIYGNAQEAADALGIDRGNIYACAAFWTYEKLKGAAQKKVKSVKGYSFDFLPNEKYFEIKELNEGA